MMSRQYSKETDFYMNYLTLFKEKFRYHYHIYTLVEVECIDTKRRQLLNKVKFSEKRVGAKEGGLPPKRVHHTRSALLPPVRNIHSKYQGLQRYCIKPKISIFLPGLFIHGQGYPEQNRKAL